ncbi:proteasome activator [Actinomycetospora cinnamomea]|uniref:Bacterial proteasome activator n=1 Tax=Actinomycetospora cinnamomea TaxID=663609 RepID=A0A2U1F2C3_9PSEU|nr:proteasome activator [Actinomycetospora cinnamomea]PVZ06334.1 uncharacterized protein DUF2587 [Actinomycetospora cinnamomea]
MAVPIPGPETDTTDGPEVETALETAPAAGPVIRDSRRWSRDDRSAPAAAPAPPTPAAAPSEGSGADPDVIDAGPLLRIGTMIRKVLEEVRETPLDDRARERVRDLRTRAMDELVTHLGPDLREELQALDVPLPTDEVAGDAELRIAQAQLVGWLEGLFQGAQMALAAQQMAARSQLSRLRSEAQPQGDTSSGHGGQYL